MTFAPGEKQAAEPAAGSQRLLVADDHEAFALDAFDLQPVAGTSRAIGLIPMLGDDPFEAHVASFLEKCGAIPEHFLGQVDGAPLEPSRKSSSRCRRTDSSVPVRL